MSLNFNIRRWDDLIKFPGKIVVSPASDKEDDFYIMLDAFIYDGVPIALGTNNYGNITIYVILTKNELDNFAENHDKCEFDPNHGIIYPEMLIDEKVYWSGYMCRFREALYNYSNIDVITQNIEFKGKYLVGWDFQHNMDIKEREFLEKLWEVIKASRIPRIHTEILERDREIIKNWENSENKEENKKIIINDLYLSFWLDRMINAIHPKK